MAYQNLIESEERIDFKTETLPVCLSENPHRLVSLWDIVDEFKLLDFSVLLTRLQATESTLRNWIRDSSTQPLNPDTIANVAEIVDKVGEYCVGVGFRSTANVSAIAYMFLTSDASRHLVNTSSVEVQITQVKSQFMADAGNQKFVSIPAKPRDYAEYVNRDDLYGPDVATAFPLAKSDIQATGNCLAVGLWTAAIFHSMRVAEHCLRFLARRLRVSLTHRGAAHPIEFADWDKIITGCKNQIANARALPHGSKRQAKLELYSDAADHCTFMKDIWRNSISHTRKPYLESEAHGAFERARDFAQFCAKMKA